MITFRWGSARTINFPPLRLVMLHNKSQVRSTSFIGKIPVSRSPQRPYRYTLRLPHSRAACDSISIQLTNIAKAEGYSCWHHYEYAADSKNCSWSNMVSQQASHYES